MALAFSAAGPVALLLVLLLLLRLDRRRHRTDLLPISFRTPSNLLPIPFQSPSIDLSPYKERSDELRGALAPARRRQLDGGRR